MKWRYNFDMESKQWHKTILPKKYYCGNCIEERAVYYLLDDIHGGVSINKGEVLRRAQEIHAEKELKSGLPPKTAEEGQLKESGAFEQARIELIHKDARTKFDIMMICSICTYHLAPIVIWLEDAERIVLDQTLKKEHSWGSVTMPYNPTNYLIAKASVIPYGFVDGKPQYPNTNLLNQDLYDLINQLGVVPDGTIELMKKREAKEEELANLYRKAKQFRQELDRINFPQFVPKNIALQ